MGAPRAEHHLGAAPREQPCGRCADAAACARDEDDFFLDCAHKKLLVLVGVNHGATLRRHGDKSRADGASGVIRIERRSCLILQNAGLRAQRRGVLSR
jgi:hypothetical protein